MSGSISNQDKFVEYYKQASESEETAARFARVRDLVVGCLGASANQWKQLVVADVGCGVGTQAAMWAADGHTVKGIDVNAALIEEGRHRAASQHLAIELTVGTAEALPWEDGSFDVCLVPELLEHVANWEGCLDEFARVMKPGGALYLATTNRYCPLQQEYTLPLYSWYPARLKRYCESRAVKDKPHWVNYAKYPAVNWFTFYELRDALARRGIQSFDHFDIRARSSPRSLKTVIAELTSRFPPLRFALQFVTPYSMVVGIKQQNRPLRQADPSILASVS